ncbi:hypothetical protein HID58_005686 [Brassica napus]|uniref:Uncharacterized protein n=1 Tax=Brassica napus TaxID=3708 RepID=A0ABQ8E997_BRANA|nr:hypothetical protein HID58_005686 [Brassica napus]
MGKRKAPKKSSPPKFPLGAHTQVSTENGTPMAVDFTIASHVTEEASASQITASASKLQDPTSDLTSGSEKPITVVSVNSAKVATVTDPGTTPLCDEKEEGEISPINSNLVPAKEAPTLGVTGRPVHNSKEVRTNTKGANDLQPPTSSLKSSKASFNSMEKGEASLPVV